MGGSRFGPKNESLEIAGTAGHHLEVETQYKSGSKSSMASSVPSTGMDLMLGAGGYCRRTTALCRGFAAAVAATLAVTAAQAADLGAAPYRAPSQYGVVGWGGWIFYPSVILGAVYDDNVFRSETNRVHDWGTRIVPSFTAEFNDGIHRTTAYGTVDARFYSENRQGDAVDAKAGFAHNYEAERDLVFRFSGDYVRQADPFTAGIVSAVGAPIVSNNTVNNLAGTASVQKDFYRAFVVLGGTVNQTNYDSSLQRGRDGTIYTTTGRGGVWITPYVNAFVQGSLDWRRYAFDPFDSSGYRVVGGLATPQVGLFQGEIYGGYQEEHYDNALFGRYGGSVYGAKLAYFPTRYWAIKALVDRTISVSAVTPGGAIVAAGGGAVIIGPGGVVLPALGTPMQVTHVALETDWGLWREVSVSGRFGYDHADYLNSIRVDNAWFAGARLNKDILRGLGVSLDYQYTRLSSNVPLNSYYRNMVMLGALYRY